MAKDLIRHPYPHFFTFEQAVSSPVIVLLLVCFSLWAESVVAYSAFTWFREGIYVEYSFDSGSISFMNGTFFPFPKESPAKAIFRWECTHTTQNTSRLNVALSFSRENHDFWFSTLFDVDFETRRVTTLNGTYVGLTFLWLRPKLEENQTIAVTDGVMGNVSMVGVASTPQGLHETFWVTSTGQIDGRTIAPGGGYDWDTGILLESMFWGEPALIVLGILDPGVVGATRLSATNIYLGPARSNPENSWDALFEALSMTIPVGTLALTILAMSKRRKPRKKATRLRGLKSRLSET